MLSKFGDFQTAIQQTVMKALTLSKSSIEFITLSLQLLQILLYKIFSLWVDITQPVLTSIIQPTLFSWKIL